MLNIREGEVYVLWPDDTYPKLVEFQGRIENDWYFKLIGHIYASQEQRILPGEEFMISRFRIKLRSPRKKELQITYKV